MLKKDFDEELENSSQGLIIIDFDSPEEGKCTIFCKEFNIYEVMDYKKGEEEIIKNRALELICEQLDHKIHRLSKRLLFGKIVIFIASILAIGIGLFAAFLNLYTEEFLMGFRNLYESIIICLLLFKAIYKKPSSTVIGIMYFINGWLHFFNSGYLWGSIWLLLGSLNILTDNS